METVDLGADRRERLAAARLYLVCSSGAGDSSTGSGDSSAEPGSGAPGSEGSGELPQLVREAVAGGVQLVQLREKQLGDDELAAVAHALQALCEQLRVPLIVNDRPAVALAAGADGVHVGQDDLPVARVRELVGPDVLIGLSTHTPEQIDAANSSGADYIGVGPIHATPTKPGRAAVGVELARYAATHARLPWFAIGGLDEGNLGAAIAAGARRAAVVRAITDAENPARAARALRELLDEHPLGGEVAAG
ncbi:MAG TPA: thiamine phosphate synthase [Solirubrobacteraceae bacterium]|nr:thiamine phosphate synthase [Solirubrobacteraceae bacterium]